MTENSCLCGNKLYLFRFIFKSSSQKPFERSPVNSMSLSRSVEKMTRSSMYWIGLSLGRIWAHISLGDETSPKGKRVGLKVSLSVAIAKRCDVLSSIPNCQNAEIKSTLERIAPQWMFCNCDWRVGKNSFVRQFYRYINIPVIND